METDGSETDRQDRADGARDADGRKRLLRGVAVQAAALSAAVHLLWAWPRLADPVDPRPYLFVLAAGFTTIVAVATVRADEYRRLYALGAGTLAVYLVGYAGWHGRATATALAADPLAIVGKVAEAVGVVAFLGLYRLAPPTSVVVARRRERTGAADGDAGEPDDTTGEGSTE
jgi:hypothetical protein